MGYRPSARQLEYFVALAQERHFGRAAQKCNVSQPTLSMQFKLLEENIEAKLIERGAGGVVLTAAGERLLPFARQALQALDSFVTMAESGRENLGGLVRLGAAPTFGPYFMPYFLPVLKSAYPDLELYIREDRPDLLEQRLADGTLECIITPHVNSSEKFEIVKLCEEELSLALPRTHPLAGLQIIPVEALRGERILSPSEGFRLRDDVQELARVAGAELREDYEGTSLDAMRQMVSIGMGLALFPAAYVHSEFGKEPDLVLKQVYDMHMQRTINMAWRIESSRSAHFRTLYDLAGSAVATMAVRGITAYRS